MSDETEYLFGTKINFLTLKFLINLNRITSDGGSIVWICPLREHLHIYWSGIGIPNILSIPITVCMALCSWMLLEKHTLSWNRLWTMCATSLIKIQCKAEKKSAHHFGSRLVGRWMLDQICFWMQVSHPYTCSKVRWNFDSRAIEGI